MMQPGCGFAFENQGVFMKLDNFGPHRIFVGYLFLQGLNLLNLRLYLLLLSLKLPLYLFVLLGSYQVSQTQPD